MIALAETVPRYKTGQIVRHLRYKYRGVIVSVDSHCQADDQWYYSNRTQPDQNQAWYHVLVDRTGGVTYVAESNLREDDRTAEIEHPLVPLFFDGFCQGCYQRNDRPWQGWV